MSSVRRKENTVIAVLCSDLHISLNPPIARSVESNWLEVQAYYLAQVADLCNEHKCPLIIAGDIFNKWNEPPEAINFLMGWLPEDTFAVPGQHDLPNHRYEDIKKSSFYTLVMSGDVKLLPFGERKHIKGDWFAYGYPWGFDITEEIDQDEDQKSLAVIHSYVWMNDDKYTGAPKDKYVNKWQDKLSDVGFNAAVFGDNHKGFLCMSDSTNQEGPWIMNCGTLIRRTIDEINYKPRVGLLHYRGDIEEYNLDCSKDKFIEIGEALKAIDSALEATEFIQELTGLGRTLVDFFDAVERFCKRNNLDKRVVDIVQKAMQDKKWK